jgi:hypothetical protein
VLLDEQLKELVQDNSFGRLRVHFCLMARFFEIELGRQTVVEA